MNSPLLQLLVLAGIAIFLILRLRNVLGTREGFEKPPAPMERAEKSRPNFEVIDGGPDRDITDHVEEGSPQAQALAEMKAEDDTFSVSDFVSGARGAYEMIVMAYETGDLASIKDFLDADVYEAFAAGVEAREAQGLTIEANFIGVRETTIEDAVFDADETTGSITMRFVAELTSVVRDKGGDIIEGSATEIKRQKDTWTFTRDMANSDPNWILTATGD